MRGLTMRSGALPYRLRPQHLPFPHYTQRMIAGLYRWRDRDLLDFKPRRSDSRFIHDDRRVFGLFQGDDQSPFVRQQLSQTAKGVGVLVFFQDMPNRAHKYQIEPP